MAAENKTKATDASVEKFIKGVTDKQKQADCRTIIDLMQTATKAPPKMWGSAIVGFGERHLKYDSGREMDWMIIGFSPRKQNITLYVPGGLDQQADLLEKLGKHSIGKGCVYINKLEDVNMPTLKKIIQRSVKAEKTNTASA
jgi:Domain of unknown function (DU1801)